MLEIVNVVPELVVVDKVVDDVERLRQLIEPRLRDVERPTFEVRRAVTHGDIEIFLNGRLYPVTCAHFLKVQAAKIEQSFVKQVLETLRSKKYERTGRNFSYTLENVQQEILHAIGEILDQALPEEQVHAIEEQICERLKVLLQVEEVSHPLTVSQQKAAIRLISEALVASLKSDMSAHHLEPKKTRRKKNG